MRKQQPSVDDETRVYPNPASHEIIVEGACDRVELFNNYGQQLLSQELGVARVLHRIGLPGLPDGVYLLKVCQKGRTITVHKFIILH
ncbi:MAG: T9SS type A sorting domain-containing protein [Phaeodactylibacter sp.]|nr:T9SS type A sorting domain-containing protein [Phaeodactylibacter sp.]